MSIQLSNGHKLQDVVASGALAFDGKGWAWERPLVRMGKIRPDLFTVVGKTVTLEPRKGNLRWLKPWTWLPFSPWSCVRKWDGNSVVNKVGLTNPGLDWWQKKIGPTLRYSFPFVGSIFGTQEELVKMAIVMSSFKLVGLEINPSCPNTGHGLTPTDEIVSCVTAVKAVCPLPLIVKVSVAQNYCEIASRLKGIAEAVSLNSVPWELVYPNTPSPLRLLEKKVGGGGGGISGYRAKQHNWRAVKELAKLRALPVIAPSIMEYDDLERVDDIGASAHSYGAIHIFDSTKPTQFVLRHRERKK